MTYTYTKWAGNENHDTAGKKLDLATAGLGRIGYKSVGVRASTLLNNKDAIRPINSIR